MMITDAQRIDIHSHLKNLRIHNYTIQSDGTVDVPGDVNICEFDNMTVLPVKFGTIAGKFKCYKCKSLSSVVGMPQFVDGYLSIRQCPKLMSLAGFNMRVKGSIFADWSNITSGGIGLIFSGSRNLQRAPSDLYLPKPFRIIDEYLNRPDDIFDCQMELIDAGYAEYAIL